MTRWSGSTAGTSTTAWPKIDRYPTVLNPKKEIRYARSRPF
jgi:hypothetical protein